MVVSNATQSAAEAWRTRIEAHDAQSLRARGDKPGYEDFWSTLAGGFRADPKRTDDPVVNLLREWVTPETTVLDVVGGAGRYALPLALKCRQVTVVEPSPAMVAQLEDAARSADIGNVSVVQATWEEAEVEPADLVLCTNVVYGVADIAPFVSKLNERARERVVVFVYMDAPVSVLSPLWRAVHLEERIELPALPELLPVLWEMGVFPNVEMLPAMGPRSLPSLEAAIQFSRRLLYVEPDTEEDQRLLKAAAELAVETPEGVTLRGYAPRPQGVVWWRPESGL